VPAASPIAISLQAGFMEECVFRAIPLALGALIGERFGRADWASRIAFVVQALCSAARTRTIRPSRVFAPGRVDPAVDDVGAHLPALRPPAHDLLHATFDLRVFSIPLFLIDAPGARLQQALVIAAALVPAAMVPGGAFRPVRGRHCRAPAQWRLAADASRRGTAATQRRRAPPPPTATRSCSSGAAAPRPRRHRRLARVHAFQAGRADAHAVRATRRSRAPTRRSPRAACAGPQWRRFGGDPSRERRCLAVELAQVRLAAEGRRRLSQADRQRAAAAAVGSALRALRRRRRRPGEEWNATVASDGTVRTLRHVLPQARAGARPTREQALPSRSAKCARVSASIPRR
jgi:hypothetical protein